MHAADKCRRSLNPGNEATAQVHKTATGTIIAAARLSDQCSSSARTLHICIRHLEYRELGEHGLLLIVIALVCILIIHGGGNGLGIAKASPRFIVIC
jgi:hypothetical protein